MYSLHTGDLSYSKVDEEAVLPSNKSKSKQRRVLESSDSDGNQGKCEHWNRT